MPCLTPGELKLSDGRVIAVRCRKCESCRSDRVRDLVGRALAEKETSVGSSYVTLTYGTSRTIDGAKDLPGARVVTYKDAQDWLKRIRKKHKVRYIVAGEYGSLKGRAHFHALLFWKDKVPNYSRTNNWTEDPFWVREIDGVKRQIGFTNWKEVDFRACKYVCKYMLKSQDDPDYHSMVRLSRNPILGKDYFDIWVKRHIDQQLPLSSRLYTVPGSFDPETRRPWQYYLNDAALRYVCSSYIRQWREVHGHDRWPFSELIERYLNRDASAPVLGRLPPERKKFPRELRPSAEPPPGYRVSFSEVLNLYVATNEDNREERLFWTYQFPGNPGWSSEIDTPVVTPVDRSFYGDGSSLKSPPEHRLGKPPRKETSATKRERLDRKAYQEAMKRPKAWQR